jgi:predicted nucleotidyltransferase
MEQISYNNAILALYQESTHVRALAKEIHVSGMQASRLLRQLQSQLLVDYAREGRNKVYFLRNTVESRSALNAAEHHKLISLIKKYPLLRSVIEDIQKDKKTKLALIFGSHAKGIAKEQSDIDIFIQTKDRTYRERLKMVDSRAAVKTGSLSEGGPLVNEIHKNHVIIKGVEEYHAVNPILEHTTQRRQA